MTPNPPSSHVPLEKSHLPRRRTQLAPMLLTILAGVFLALGSCFGFLNTMNQGAHAGDIYVGGFFAGCVVAIASTIWLVIAIILAVVRLIRRNYGGQDTP